MPVTGMRHASSLDEVASAARVAAPARFGFGSFVVGTFATWLRALPALATLAVLASAPAAALLWFWQVHTDGAPFMERRGGFGLLAASVLYAALKVVERGAEVLLVVRRLDGERVGLRAALGAGLRRFPQVLGVRLAYWAVVLAGLAAAAVPGLWAAAGCCAATPATVLEDAGPIEALRRSWALSRGRRAGLLLGIAVIHVVILAGGLAEILVFTTFLPEDATATTPEFDGVAMAALVTVASVLGTPARVAEAVAYHRLRAVHEGDARALAEVFE